MKKLLTLLAVVSFALPACGGSQPAATGPSEAEQEAEAAEAVKAQEDALLEQDEPIDDGFEEDAEGAGSENTESTSDEVTENGALE